MVATIDRTRGIDRYSKWNTYYEQWRVEHWFWSRPRHFLYLPPPPPYDQINTYLLVFIFYSFQLELSFNYIQVTDDFLTV